ncbi:hypothetical protein TI03_05060, partial [Achromatium sp. WMS1]
LAPLTLWDAATGQKIWTSAKESLLAAFSPDGKQIISLLISYDSSYTASCTLEFWDVATRKKNRTVTIKQCDSSPSIINGKYLLSIDAVSDDDYRFVKLFDVVTGKKISDFTMSQVARFQAVSPSNQTILFLNFGENVLRLMDITTGQEVQHFVTNYNPVNSVAFSPDGRHIIYGGGKSDTTTANGTDDPTIKLWDMATGRLIRTFDLGISKHITSLAFSPNGKQIASGTWDNITLLDVTTGRNIRTFGAKTSSLAFSPNGEQILSNDTYHGPKLWSVATGQLIRSIGNIKSHGSALFSPDGKQIIVSNRGVGLKVFDTTTGQEISTITNKNIAPNQLVASSPNGKQILSVTGGNEEIITLLDLETGQEILTFTGHSGSITSVAFSSDGNQIVSGGVDTTIRLWDIATRKEIRVFRGHYGIVDSVAFSPDDKRRDIICLPSGENAASRDSLAEVQIFCPVAASQSVKGA